VRVLDNLSSGNLNKLSKVRPFVDFYHGDVCNFYDSLDAYNNVDAVIHNAGIVSVPESFKDPINTLKVNLGGTQTVLDSCMAHGIDRLVFASSAAVYASPKEESPYSRSKQEAERLIEAYQKHCGMTSVCLRYFNIYGPRSKGDGVVAKFVGKALRGEPFLITGDGEQTRDYVYVEDVAKANVLAAVRPGLKGHRTYDIGCGVSVSLNKLSILVEEIVGSDQTRKYFPQKTQEVKHSSSDIGPAQQEISYFPRFNLYAGLKKLIEHERGSIWSQ